MKAGNIIIKAILIVTGTVYLSGAQAQGVEYDDLYFNKSDRKKQKELKTRIKSPVLEEAGKGEVPVNTQEYSSKNVNPEYLARYNATDETSYEMDEDVADNEYTEEDYYVETEDRIQNNQEELINSQYASNYNRPDYYRYNNYNRHWNRNYGYGFSPYYTPAGWNMGLGYNFGSFYGRPYSGYNMMFSWSSGGYYSYYDPWYDPWYDSWYGYSPYYYSNPWRYGYYGSFYGYNHFYYPRYTHVTVIEGRNNYTYGRRDSRSSSSVVTRDSGTRSRINATNTRSSRTTSVSNTSNNRVSRDYSTSQNEYYNTRTRSIDSRSAVNVRNIDRSSSSSRISNTSSRTSTSTVERPTRTRTYSYPNTNSNSRNYNSNATRSRSTNSYSTPSRSSSGNSYSTPSRSRSTYSTPSRSSSPSYSSGSRSSSGSSYTPSRSSGRSSSRSGR